MFLSKMVKIYAYLFLVLAFCACLNALPSHQNGREGLHLHRVKRHHHGGYGYPGGYGGYPGGFGRGFPGGYGGYPGGYGGYPGGYGDYPGGYSGYPGGYGGYPGGYGGVFPGGYGGGALPTLFTIASSRSGFSNGFFGSGGSSKDFYMSFGKR